MKRLLVGMVALSVFNLAGVGKVFAEENQIEVEGVVEEIAQSIGADSVSAQSSSTSSDFSSDQVRKIQEYQKRYKEIRNKDVIDEKFSVAPIIGLDQYTTGTFHQETLDNATDYINLLRESAGLPTVSLSQAKIDRAQHASVALAGLRVIDHYIGTNYPKPVGMTDTFWQEASTGARLSNLARSVRSPMYGEKAPSLNEFSDLYMFDYGAGNQSVGHRRIILNPFYRTIGFGFAELEVPERREVEYSGALYAQGDGGTTVPADSIAAWPTESIFPIQNMKKYNSNLRWSVNFNSIGYDFDKNNLKVTLTNKKTDQKWQFSNNQKDGEFTVTNTWGYDSVIFAPDNISYAEGDEFSVKVEGLTGSKESYEYSTKLYDLNKEYKLPLEDFDFEESRIKMKIGETKQLKLNYSPADAEYDGKIIWSSSNSNLASVSQDGVLTAKAYAYGGMTVTAKTEDGKITKSIKVSMANVMPGATKETAVEIDPGFSNANGNQYRLYLNQSGWVKFKADETAMYSVYAGISLGSVIGRKGGVDFENEFENRSLGYISSQNITHNSSSRSSNLPVYYEKGEYVYLKLSTSIDGEPFTFVLCRDTKNPQPIYTKKVTIISNRPSLLTPNQSTSYSYKVDSFTTKPNEIQYHSDDASIAEVVPDGSNRFKIIGKKEGKTTIRVKETSGSNQEGSVEITVFSLGETQKEATEIQPDFGYQDIFANQTGWLKFKAPETAKYDLYSLWSQDTATSSHRIETNFYDETKWIGYKFADCKKGGGSASTGSNLPVSANAGDYIYVHIANRKTDAPYYFGFKYRK